MGQSEFAWRKVVQTKLAHSTPENTLSYFNNIYALHTFSWLTIKNEYSSRCRERVACFQSSVICLVSLTRFLHMHPNTDLGSLMNGVWKEELWNYTRMFSVRFQRSSATLAARRLLWVRNEIQAKESVNLRMCGNSRKSSTFLAFSTIRHHPCHWKMYTTLLYIL